MQNTKSYNYEQLINFLWSANFEEALKMSSSFVDDEPEDMRANVCYAWALTENGYVEESLNFIKKASKIDSNNPFVILINGYILYRTGQFEEALEKVENAIELGTEYQAWARIIKARILAYLCQYYEAYNVFSLLYKAMPKDENVVLLNKWFSNAAGYIENNIYTNGYHDYFLEEAKKSFKKGEYWFTLWVVNSITNNPDLVNYHYDAKILEISSYIQLFRFDNLNNLFEEAQKLYPNDDELKRLYNLASTIYQKAVLSKSRIKDCETKESKLSIENKISENEKIVSSQEVSEIQQKEKSNTRYTTIIEQPNKNAVLSDEDLLKLLTEQDPDLDLTGILEGVSKEYNTVPNAVKKIKIFDLLENVLGDNKKYLKTLPINIKYIGIDLFLENKNYLAENKISTIKVIAKNNEKEFDNNQITISFRKEWDTLLVDSNVGKDENAKLEVGTFTLEIYDNEEQIFSESIEVTNDLVFDDEHIEFEFIDYDVESKKYEIASDPLDEEKIRRIDIEGVLKDLDQYVGLPKVKRVMREFVDYLDFISERKKKGLKTQDNVSFHCVFLGNPGTGKTTIARILAKVFKAMGIISKGQLIETDRSGLVGQYVGETAQKTEKIIQDSIGGVLFIDEAYTLVPKGQSSDFGKEAIDILLKRMEDLKGQFIVIVAGYPEEMKDFIDSNPGLKSRFTQFFEFEDYNPDDLIEIFNLAASKEDYKIEDETLDVLKKYFIEQYRNRDKSFGNARLVRNLFEEAKVKVSKRYLQTPLDKRTRELLVTIKPEDIGDIPNEVASSTYGISIDEDLLNKELAKLNSLIGLDSVKVTISRTISSLKVAKIRESQGLKVIRKSLHSVFLGNPGTGKTTVARQLSSIFKALGYLEKGHLVEVDRSQLVAGYVGQTAEKTDQIIQKALGGTLFIDEAYTLVRNENDFGIEAVETLLKRMEDYKGEFVVIVAGYPNEMKKFIDTNPGLQSRFTNYLNFEDYTPRQMLDIACAICDKTGYKLDEGAWQTAYDFLEQIYDARDVNFGNARTVQNFLQKAIAFQEERIIQEGKTTKEDLIAIIHQDIAKIDLKDLV